MFMVKVIGRLLNRWTTWKILNSKQQLVKAHISARSRQYSNGICPPGKPHKRSEDGGGGAGGKLKWASAVLALAGGGTLVYAHFNPEFRKTVTSLVPALNPILDAMDQYSPSTLYSNTKQSLLDKFAHEEARPVKKGQIPEPKEYKAPPPIIPHLEKDVKKHEDAYNEIRVKAETGVSDEFDIAGEPKPQLSPRNTTALAELEAKICHSAEEAVNAYHKAVHVLLSYNQDIEYMLDEAVNQVEPEIWEKIRLKTRHKNECLKRAQEKADEASRDVNRLKELIASPDFDAPENTKSIIRNNISKVQDDINTAKKELEIELQHGSVTEKYWDKVEVARKNFSNELEILFPDIDISQKRLIIRESELDLFILHIYAHVLFHQKELAKIETVLQSRVDIAVEQAKKGGLEPLTVAQICEAVEQERRRLTACFQQQLLRLKKDSETAYREKLKRQAQLFNENSQVAIRAREIDIEKILTRKFDELLEEERCRFKYQLATMMGRLKGLDQAIKIRNDADASSKQAQVLWAACQSLLRAVRSGCPGIPWKDQIRPLKPEIQGVVNAASPTDELVTAVISGLPKEARERGVFPEDALRERFLKVEKVARTVDLVPAGGASLPVHILSYIQSLMLIKSSNLIPQAEINDEQIDFSNLTTHEVLQRARYWLDRGDFAQALKYMNLLKGAPRCIARQWMNETRILLETQQAANTLMAHAASSGLMYL
ncbi:unnamed protein product [Ceutorhynchus assimilis]|uniref:MICOS complex subunit MIC60 n=1 Tax=Ceutorhynchus assimilis TaxID=467358 RepID=A0A9N9MJW9_9CUCU|nr:unnamed protein product [Ceutorhynchus assimilis]